MLINTITFVEFLNINNRKCKIFDDRIEVLKGGAYGKFRTI